jgi:hypothetical protein
MSAATTATARSIDSPKFARFAARVLGASPSDRARRKLSPS